MTWLALVVAALATWRVSHMLLYENGPFRLLRKMREHLGVVYYSDDADVATYKWELTVCMWCLSVWVGIVVAILWWLGIALILTPYALSAVVCLLDRKR